MNGLPLGTGLTVYFIALEKSPAYILPGIPWGISALAGSLFFCLVYYHTGRLLKSLPRPAVILISALSGASAFTGFGFILRFFQFNLLFASFIFVFFYIINLVIINTLHIKSAEQEKRSSSAQIVFLTTVGGLAASRWAGIVSSFPSTLFALMVVLHYEEGKNMYVHVMYGIRAVRGFLQVKAKRDLP